MPPTVGVVSDADAPPATRSTEESARGRDRADASSPGARGTAPATPGTAPPRAADPSKEACAQRAIDWKDAATRARIGALMSASALFRETYDTHKGQIKVQETPAPAIDPAHLGQTGRLAVDAQNKRLVLLAIQWQRIASDMKAASVLLHEYGHARRVLRLRFTAAEVAPFVTANDYLLLRWAGEAEAFVFQSRALKQIAERKELLPCVRTHVVGDDILLALADNRIADAKVLLVTVYAAANLLGAYDRDHAARGVEQDERLIEEWLRSAAWRKERALWASFLPPAP